MLTAMAYKTSLGYRPTRDLDIDDAIFVLCALGSVEDCQTLLLIGCQLNECVYY